MLSRGYTSDFLLMMVMRARGANYPCSHPRASAAMATANTPLKKIARNWMSWTFRDKITDFVTRLATTARQRRDNFKKKSHHHRKQKIARVAAALEQGLGLRLLRTDIDEVFHPLEKRTNKKQKPRWIESFERWMTERRWRFYVPWRWHLIFQTARFVRQDKKSIVFSLSWSQTTFSTDDL